MRRPLGSGRLRHRVGAAVRDHGLWAPGARVAVAVSGGLDSVVLLDLLVDTRAWHGATLSVVTVDHGVREGSGADADFVEDLARAHGLPCTRATLGLGSASEAGMRDARRAVFDALDVDRVATAHHRDDQVETVLLRLLRGSSSAGLAGIRWTRGRMVRPLLSTSRAEIEEHARERGLSWREDPTNAALDAERNRVRHLLVPALDAVRPAAREAIARTAARLAEDDAALAELARRADPGDLWPWEALAAAPDALVRRWLLARAPAAGSADVDAALAAVRRGAPPTLHDASGRVTEAGIAWAGSGRADRRC